MFFAWREKRGVKTSIVQGKTQKIRTWFCKQSIQQNSKNNECKKQNKQANKTTRQKNAPLCYSDIQQNSISWLFFHNKWF